MPSSIRSSGFIQFDKQLLNRDQPYYVAFSGGLDSIAGSHFLLKGGYKIKLVHVNHRCIQEDIDIAIEAAVAAKMLGSEALILHADHEWDGKGSAEAYCRAVRYELLGRLDAPVIVCHHLNDVAEGYFMNCIRGNPNKVPIMATSFVTGADIIRPFLRTKKNDLEQYAFQHKIHTLIVPEVLPSERQVLRDKVFPHIQSDLTSIARRLFIDTGLIYQSNASIIG